MIEKIISTKEGHWYVDDIVSMLRDRNNSFFNNQLIVGISFGNKYILIIEEFDNIWQVSWRYLYSSFGMFGEKTSNYREALIKMDSIYVLSYKDDIIEFILEY